MGNVLESLPPPNEETVDTFYAPIGIISHNLLAICTFNNALNWGVLRFVFLTTSIAGSGVYICNRRHLRRMPSSHHLLFGAYLTALFNFGSLSVLDYTHLTTGIVPGGAIPRVLMAHALSAGLLLIGKAYLDYVDELAMSRGAGLHIDFNSLENTEGGQSGHLPHFQG